METIGYEGINWKDYPNTTTPITAENLNVLDDGIKAACDGVDYLNDVLTPSDTGIAVSGIASGNITSSGTVTANRFVGNLSGNAATSTTSENANKTQKSYFGTYMSTTTKDVVVTDTTGNGYLGDYIGSGVTVSTRDGRNADAGFSCLNIGNKGTAVPGTRTEGSIKLYSDGDGLSSNGSVTIAPPSISSNLTLLLPSSSGTVALTSQIASLKATIPEYATGSIKSGTIKAYGSSTTFSESFGKTFAHVPQVVVTPISYTGTNSRAIIVTNISVTKTGFTVTVILNGYGGEIDLSSNRRLDWIAIGNP